MLMDINILKFIDKMLSLQIEVHEKDLGSAIQLDEWPNYVDYLGHIN